MEESTTFSYIIQRVYEPGLTSNLKFILSKDSRPTE